ncbi:MAG: aspartate--tRNA ligase [bacterium]|nr:aspartate--tRNA ligase [bacterium]
MTNKQRRLAGQLSSQTIGETVTLNGWVDVVRDHGQLLFIHLRDHTGIVQVVVDQDNPHYAQSKQLRSEYVIGVTGPVVEREASAKNSDMATGEIEVHITSLIVFNTAETPPFVISEKGTQSVDEDIRLQHRYLDLRRPTMQQRLRQRHRILKTIRDYFDRHDFIEVETPMLTRSTPEGARDYLVPSRVHDGSFYALPQSPQLFKQLLMMSGLGRYMQIARCFRDEDLRPNRQPEFTQLDFEASFIDEAFIMDLINPLMQTLFAEANLPFTQPIRTLTYADAIARYGSDKPDLRFGLEFVDLSPVFGETAYKIFRSILDKGGCIKGIRLPKQSPNLSKSRLQDHYAKTVVPQLGGKGMTWLRVVGDQLESSVLQFFSDTEQATLKTAMAAESDDVIMIIADTDPQVVHDVLGDLRLHVARDLDLIDTTQVIGCWITEFPLFEKRNGQLNLLHHPFTQPTTDITPLTTEAEYLSITARAYDLVINGEEIGGGSIRIHDATIQNKVFDIAGLSDADIHEKFGFFIHALQYGTPPHGGMAVGLDRLVAMLCQTESIRDVIAFPKNRMAVCPLTKAPASVHADQLNELNIQLRG